MTKEQKVVIVSLVSGGASIAGLVIVIVQILSVQISFTLLLGIPVATAFGIACFLYFKREAPFFKLLEITFLRTYIVISGTSKTAALVDLLRIIGLIGLGVITYKQHGTQILSFNRGRIFALSLFVVYLHALIYPIVKRKTKWNVEYRKRKSMQMLALSYATIGIGQDSVPPTIIRNIEINALKAIKSYIEYTVSDVESKYFNVNLIIFNPRDPSTLVCIQRVNPIRPIPTYYSVDEMPEAMQAMQTCAPVYVGHYLHPKKEYKMIWHVPVILPHGEETKCAGLLSVDSLKSRHLDFFDDRESLLINISPYIALLRYSLGLRIEHNIWGDLS